MKKIVGYNFPIDQLEIRLEHWQESLRTLGYQLEARQGNELDLEKNWKTLPQDIAWVSLSDHEIEFCLKAFQNMTSEIILIKSCDALVCHHKAWWVRDYWSEALLEAVVRRAPRLDTHCLGYVTGGGRLARAAVLLLIKMGFSKIVWVDDQPETLAQEILEIRKKFFLVEIEPMDGSKLTLQPNNGSMLINAIGLDSGNPLLQDLFYLNFLKKLGAVVDLNLLPLDNHLLTEAETVGINTVPGWLLMGLRDALF